RAGDRDAGGESEDGSRALSGLGDERGLNLDRDDGHEVGGSGGGVRLRVLAGSGPRPTHKAVLEELVDLLVVSIGERLWVQAALDVAHRDGARSVGLELLRL